MEHIMRRGEIKEMAEAYARRRVPNDPNDPRGTAILRDVIAKTYMFAFRKAMSIQKEIIDARAGLRARDGLNE